MSASRGSHRRSGGMNDRRWLMPLAAIGVVVIVAVVLAVVILTSRNSNNSDTASSSAHHGTTTTQAIRTTSTTASPTTSTTASTTTSTTDPASRHELGGGRRPQCFRRHRPGGTNGRWPSAGWLRGEWHWQHVKQYRRGRSITDLLRAGWTARRPQVGRLAQRPGDLHRGFDAGRQQSDSMGGQRAAYGDRYDELVPSSGAPQTRLRQHFGSIGTHSTFGRFALYGEPSSSRTAPASRRLSLPAQGQSPSSRAERQLKRHTLNKGRPIGTRPHPSAARPKVRATRRRRDYPARKVATTAYQSVGDTKVARAAWDPATLTGTSSRTSEPELLWLRMVKVWP